MSSVREVEIRKHVAAKVVALRKERGLSQEKLGAALGVTFQQVQKYETCKNRISADALWGIATTLDAPISYFFPKAGEAAAVPTIGLTAKHDLRRLADGVERLVKQIGKG